MKRPANALALAVLTLLYEKPMHPYEMSTTLRHRSKEDSIRLNYGSLYAVVESLRKKGLIEAGETTREGNRPERTTYTLTETGEQAMRDWLGEMLRDPQPQFTDFEAALSLMGALPPELVADALRQRLEALAKETARHQGLRAMMPAGFPEIFTIEGDYAQHLREAETEFVRSLLDKISSGRLGGIEGWTRLHELRDAGHTGEDLQQKLAEEFPGLFEWSLDGTGG
jgi:DNA-binding PadR family transcriptional regulator